jgi:hypothetical protein
VIGDWYLDDANGDVYEKTGAATWTLRDNLTGPTGAQGPAGLAGSKWFSGTGAPSGVLGAVGDFYLDDANGDVYEKTGVSTWTLQDNLTGPTGADGPLVEYYEAYGPTANQSLDATGVIADFDTPRNTSGDFTNDGAGTITLTGAPGDYFVHAEITLDDSASTARTVEWWLEKNGTEINNSRRQVFIDRAANRHYSSTWIPQFATNDTIRLKVKQNAGTNFQLLAEKGSISLHRVGD